MLKDYFHVVLFTVIGIVFSCMVFTVAWLMRARGRDPMKNSVYECGMTAIGSPWVAPNIRFYVFALIFVIFDVEVLFLFPWAVNFRALGLTGFVEVLIFVGILLAGLFYAWKKDALNWE